MSYYICPNCGSRFFLVVRRDPTTAFTVGARLSIIAASEEASIEYKDILNNRFFCGACSWKGLLDQLHESDR